MSLVLTVTTTMVSLALICPFKQIKEHLNLGDVKGAKGVVKAVTRALRNSASLKISQDGSKVGRTTKLPNQGYSTTRPPAFNGEDYYYWKDRMRLFLEATHMDLWDIVENGPYTPTDAKGNEIPKEQWTNDQKSRVQLNFKAKFFLTFALSRSEYDKIYGCRTAKEIWDTLAIVHEGMNQVKRARTYELVHQFELFEMHDQETIDQMFGRFFTIINCLKSLGKVYDNEDLVGKILRSLPKVWTPKVTAIEESKDLSKLSLHELLGSLKVHELELKDFEDSEGDDSGDDELSFICKETMKMWKRGNFRLDPISKKTSKEGSSQEGKGQLICYECRKSGHIKAGCPQLKGNFKKPSTKKSMMATWEDLDDSSDD